MTDAVETSIRDLRDNLDRFIGGPPTDLDTERLMALGILPITSRTYTVVNEETGEGWQARPDPDSVTVKDMGGGNISVGFRLMAAMDDR